MYHTIMFFHGPSYVFEKNIVRTGEKVGLILTYSPFPTKNRFGSNSQCKPALSLFPSILSF